MNPPTPIVDEISAPYAEVSDLSNQILTFMSGKEVMVPTAIFTCALCLARVMNADEELSAEDEVRFVEAILDFAGTYYASEEGGLN